MSCPTSRIADYSQVLEKDRETAPRNKVPFKNLCCQQFQLVYIFNPLFCIKFLVQIKMFSSLIITFSSLFLKENTVYLPSDKHTFLYGTDTICVHWLSIRFLFHWTRSFVQTVMI